MCVRALNIFPSKICDPTLEGQARCRMLIQRGNGRPPSTMMVAIIGYYWDNHSYRVSMVMLDYIKKQRLKSNTCWVCETSHDPPMKQLNHAERDRACCGCQERFSQESVLLGCFGCVRQGQVCHGHWCLSWWTLVGCCSSWDNYRDVGNNFHKLGYAKLLCVMIYHKNVELSPPI